MNNPFAWSPGIMDAQEMRRREFAPESEWPQGGLADARWDGDVLVVPVGPEWAAILDGEAGELVAGQLFRGISQEGREQT